MVVLEKIIRKNSFIRNYATYNSKNHIIIIKLFVKTNYYVIIVIRGE